MTAMNTTANKITVFRMIMIPVFLVLLYLGLRFWALAVYIIACLSDVADGYIARHYNQVTNFGKFMDPLADKMLVCSALICLVQLQQLPAWVVIIVVSRDFIISGFRLVASDRGVVIAASMWGKAKTCSQMFTIGLLILNVPVLHVFTEVCVVIMVCLTVVSLVDYLVKNKEVLAERS